MIILYHHQAFPLFYKQFVLCLIVVKLEISLKHLQIPNRKITKLQFNLLLLETIYFKLKYQSRVMTLKCIKFPL